MVHSLIDEEENGTITNIPLDKRFTLQTYKKGPLREVRIVDNKHGGYSKYAIIAHGNSVTRYRYMRKGTSMQWDIVEGPPTRGWLLVPLVQRAELMFLTL